MSPATVAQLREHGVDDDSELRLEYFFYTDSPTKAAALVEALKLKNYTVESRQSAGDAALQVITGWTTPIQMTDDVVVYWTADMTRLGYEHDCEFDGWGTNPNQ